MYNYTNYWGTYTAAPKKPAEMTEQQKALLAQVAAARISTYKTITELLADEHRKDEAYYMGRKGWVAYRHRIVNGNDIYFTEPVSECPAIPDEVTKVSVTIRNRLPKEFLERILGTFNYVNNTYHKEAAAQIYRKPDGSYLLYYPEQNISGAEVSYKDDTNMIKLREENELVMEIHSHNTMDAFWSGTDDANEKETNFYMVIGKFGSPTCAYKARVKSGNVQGALFAHQIFDITPEEEVEMLKRENLKDGDVTEIESKIIKTVATRTYSKTNTTYSYNNYGHGFYYDDYYYGSYYDAYRTSYSSKTPSKNKKGMRRLLNKLKKANMELIPSSSKLSSELWKVSNYDAKTGQHVACGYTYTFQEKGWKKVGDLDKLDAVYSFDSTDEDVTKAYKRIQDYTGKVADAFCLDKLNDEGTVTNYYNSDRSKCVIDYLLGTIEDDKARLVDVPGRIEMYSDYNTPVFDSEDKKAPLFYQAVHAQIVTRMQAQLNVEDSYYEQTVASSAANHEKETKGQFIEKCKEKCTKTEYGKSFNLVILWETLTTLEKSRLCKVLEYDLVTLMYEMTEFIVDDGGDLTWEAMYLIFNAILDPEHVNIDELELNTGSNVFTELNTKAVDYVHNRIATIAYWFAELEKEREK